MTPGGGENTIKKLLSFEHNNKTAWAQHFTWQQTMLGIQQSHTHCGIDSRNQCFFLFLSKKVFEE